MLENDKRILSDFFHVNYKEYGYDPRSLGWNVGTQENRFAVLLEVGNMEGCSVLDVGCGFGDLYKFLKDRGVNVDYTGIDLSAEFIEVARELHPEARFVVGDFEEDGIRGQYDWVMECGIFNRKVTDQRRFVERTLQRMYEVAKKGVAADFLAPKQVDLLGHVYHADPGEMLRFCKKISSQVVLRWDYKPQEFCVYIYKDREVAPADVFSATIQKIRQLDLRKGRSWG